MTPAIFFGHGSPMNAIEHNKSTNKWLDVIKSVPRPAAILIISAHWETSGTKITGNAQLSTIYDFGGFPQALVDKKYPAQGNPKLAKAIADKVGAQIDNNWGLDHGAWSVLAQIYPKADIPVLQMSLDHNKTSQQHFELGQKLSYLRNEGVLVIGSGNIVHNLRLMGWNNPAKSSWATDFNKIIIEHIQNRQFDNLINYRQYGDLAQKSVPSPEHYLPLLYVLGASKPKDKIDIFDTQVEMGAIAMTSVKFG